MKKKLKHILFAIIPTIIILFGIEMSSRIYYCIKNDNWSYILYGLTHTELDGTNQTQIMQIRESKKTNLQYQEYINNRSNNEYKHIFCVGASTTVGIDIENNYPRYLNNYINKDTSRSKHLVHIIGKGHIHSNSFINMIDEELKFCMPELIIIYCGYNDIFNRSINTATTATIALKSVIFLEKYSLFIKIAKEKYYVLKHESVAKKEGMSSHNLAKKLFNDNMTSVVNFINKNQIKVILIPDILDSRKFNGLSKTYEDFNVRNKDISITLKNTCKNNKNAYYLNLYNSFDFINEENDVHADVAHLNNKGYDILAKSIYEYLLKNKFIK